MPNLVAESFEPARCALISVRGSLEDRRDGALRRFLWQAASAKKISIPQAEQSLRESVGCPSRFLLQVAAAKKIVEAAKEAQGGAAKSAADANAEAAAAAAKVAEDQKQLQLDEQVAFSVAMDPFPLQFGP